MLLVLTRSRIVYEYTMMRTQGTGLPFNNYSWLTTHNSYALLGAVSATGAAIISPTNQEDTVTAQLKVRLTNSTSFPFSRPCRAGWLDPNRTAPRVRRRLRRRRRHRRGVAVGPGSP